MRYALSKGLAALLCIVMLTACAPHFRPPGPETEAPRIDSAAFVMPDGTRLPFRSWGPGGRGQKTPVAIIVALHGFNDYSRAFAAAGRWWAKRGIRTYAYDQRGFGKTDNAGFWPTGAALETDLKTVLRLVGNRHAGLPIFVVGESMGGAVAIAALTDMDGSPLADGAILAAPAVWGWSSMNPFYRIALWWGAHLFPGMQLTGESLDVLPSDNIAMLRAMAEDPLVIKKTRVDAVYGLVDLMEDASDSAGRLSLPTLLLYGDKDEIIPGHAIERIREHMSRYDITVYEDGYHMLLRDCQAPRVWADILSWIDDRTVSAEAGAGREAASTSGGHPQCIDNVL